MLFLDQDMRLLFDFQEKQFTKKSPDTQFQGRLTSQNIFKLRAEINHNNSDYVHGQYYILENI